MVVTGASAAITPNRLDRVCFRPGSHGMEQALNDPTIRTALYGLRSLLLWTLAFPTALLVTGIATSPVASGSEALYQSAVEAIRAGRPETAVPTLESLRHQYPDIVRYDYDYIHALGLSGFDRKVLSNSARVDPQTGPPYVLETIARSARNLGETDRSARIYRTLIRRYPQRLEPRIGLALVQIDQGQPGAAIISLQRIEQQHPRNIPVLATLAYAYELSDDYFRAIYYYERILALDPEVSSAERHFILAINQIHANDIALQEADRHPQVLSIQDWALLKWDRAAYQVRWGEIPPDTRILRFSETDRAIVTLKKNREFSEKIDIDRDVWLNRMRYDLIIALRDRYQMKDVIEYADILKQQEVDPPAYVTSAIGDAYLYLEEPERARDCYLKALEQDPSLFNTELALFYAYIEAEQHEEATALIDSMARNQPEVRRHWLADGKKSIIKGNPKKTVTESTAALARAYGNYLDEAEQRFNFLTDSAPFNINLRRELANVYYWRGWPRAAQDQYDQGLSIDPQHLGLRLGDARNQHELRHYRQAESMINDLEEYYPEDKGVQKQALLWRIHNDRELFLAVRGGHQSGNVIGSDTLTFEGRLYSEPLDYNYRVFIHTLWNTTRFPEGDGELGHYGIGLEYRVPNLLLTVEVADNDYQSNRVGGTLTASYDFDDYWNLFGSLESFAAETPYRALKNNVYASAINLGVRHRVSESRSFAVAGAFMPFSDGNKRGSILADYQERWYTSPEYILNTTLSAYYSHNTKQNVPYFNPKNDVSLAVTFDNDWLTYRRYDKSFHQRFALTAGGYWQDGFGSGPIGAFLYEHRWNTDYRLELIYGGAVTSRMYDGGRETGIQYYMTLNWRF